MEWDRLCCIVTNTYFYFRFRALSRESFLDVLFSFTKEIEGRVYVDIGKSAKEVALLILWTIYPRRMGSAELEASVVRHDYSGKNAHLAVSRLAGYVDDDGRGNLRLRNSGVKKAEELISKASLG